MLYRTLLRITHACGLCAARTLLRTWIWSPLIGTARLYLGAQHGILPAIQGYSHVSTIIMSSVLQAGLCCISASHWLGILRNLPLPTMIASIYIALSNRVSRSTHICATVSLACLGWTCFLSHPTGWSAAAYTIYWVIPVICAIWARASIMVRMFGATFSAHIIGSCIWLYTTNMPAAGWIALIPVVALERLPCAATLTAVYYACIYHVQIWQYICRLARGVRKQIYAHV